MTDEELDAYLTARRTCRVATVGSRGEPHVSALWFVWDGAAVWLYSLVRSRRWADLAGDPRVAVLVDDGEEFHELRGVEIRGRAEAVGEVPRTGAFDPVLACPEALFARKYAGGGALTYDGRHGWLRVAPEKVASWDFRRSGSRTDARTVARTDERTVAHRDADS